MIGLYRVPNVVGSVNGDSPVGLLQFPIDWVALYSLVDRAFPIGLL
jgi:hypothetical protein